MCQVGESDTILWEGITILSYHCARAVQSGIFSIRSREPRHTQRGSHMRHLIGKIGNVWTQLDRSPCPTCGGTKYTVTVKCEARTEDVGLLLRCSLCARLRGVVKDIGACVERHSHVRR